MTVAVAALHEYLRRTTPDEWISDPCEGFVLFLRVLFDPPNSQTLMPRIRIGGGPTLPEPADRSPIPRFPVSVEKDVPLLLVSGYVGSGSPERVTRHIKAYSGFPLREKPLAPTAEPLSILEDFRKSRRWLYGKSCDQVDPMAQNVESVERASRCSPSSF